MAEVEEVTKGGECWLQISIDRRSKGLEVYIKADPRVEEFMASVSNGKFESLESYSRNWCGKDPLNPLKVYVLDRELTSNGYLLNNVCGNLIDGRTSNVNLSFLQFVGISNPEGIRFMISGPFQDEYVKGLIPKILTATRTLLKTYIVPIHINLRISSQEI